MYMANNKRDVSYGTKDFIEYNVLIPHAIIFKFFSLHTHMSNFGRSIFQDISPTKNAL